MLMLFACFATFLFTSSKAEMFGWPGAADILLIMEGSGSSEDRLPMFDKAAVMVAVKTRKTRRENKNWTNEKTGTGDNYLWSCVR